MIPITVILLMFLLTFAFPRGIRITLGRRALWLAPPAVPLYSYFRIAAHYQEASAKYAELLATMRDKHDECDRMLAYLCEDFPELVATGRIEVRHDPIIRVMVVLLAGFEADARLHFEAFQEHADRANELLAQPVDRSIYGLLAQDAELVTSMKMAWVATHLRVSGFREWLLTVKRVLQPLKDQALQLDSRQTALDEISAALQTLGDQVDGIDDEIAQVRQPGRGRPAKRQWSDAEIRDLHAAYLVRNEQTATQFAQRNHLTESQMFKLFRRVGITKKGPGNYDSEL